MNNNLFSVGDINSVLGINKELGESQGSCGTTLTERFFNPNCICDTYPDNLGPCKTYVLGGNGRCCYCDHKKSCHDELLNKTMQ